MTERHNIESRVFWRDEYLKFICGFANTNGGKIFIGISKGEPTGCLDVPKLMRYIPNLAKEFLGISVTITVCWDNFKKYVEVIITPHHNPVSYKGRYYIRHGIATRELKGKALDKFLLRKQGKPWDGVPVPRIAITDLNDQAFEHLRKRAITSKRLPKEEVSVSNNLLLEKLRLIEGTYLKRAALLLFHPDPEIFFSGAYIKIGFFKSHTDLLYHDTIHGNLFEQVDKTMDLLLTKYRVDTYPFPEEAIRTAVINAILCKDYECGNPIQISVCVDKLYIWNQGKLLDKHPSLPNNPCIANVFFQTGYLESWEGGMKKIIGECANAGLSAPVFDFDANGLMIEIRSKPREIIPKMRQY